MIRAVLALAFAIALAFLAARHALALDALPQGSAAAACALFAGLAASIPLLRARAGADALVGARTGSDALVGALALVVLAAATGFAGACALPDDLHLRTVGRPPQSVVLLALGVSLAAAFAVRLVARGASCGRASLALLVPLLTLEGLPFGTSSAFQLGVAAVCVLLPSGAQARAPRPRGLLAIGVFVGAGIVSTLLGADPTTGVELAIRWLALSAGFVVIASDAAPLESARTAIGALLATVIGVAAAGLLGQFLLQRELAPLHVDAWLTELSLYNRHPNLLAPWFGAAAVLALRIALRPARTAAGVADGLVVLARVALAPAIALTFLTASRLTIAAVAVVVLLPLLLRVRVERKAALRLAVVVGVLVAAFFVFPAFREKLLRADFTDRLAENHRVHRMEVALTTALDRPMLGQGPLTWFRQGAFTPPSRFDGEESNDHPHDVFLAVFEGMGLVGLLLFLALLAAATRLAYDLRRVAGDEHALASAVASALLVQLITSTLDAGDALDTLVPSRLFLDVGILAALSRSANLRIGLLACPGFVRAVLGVALAAAATFDLHTRVLLDEARVLVKLDEPDDAAQRFTELAKRRPFDVDLRLQIAGLSVRGQGARLAREAMDEALDLAPLRPDVQESRARYLAALGNPGPALNAAKSALELDPRGATPHRIAQFRAQLLLETGDETGAIDALARALNAAPALAAQLAAPDGTDRLMLGGRALSRTAVEDAMTRASSAGDAARSQRRLPLRLAEVAMHVKAYDAALAHLETMQSIDAESQAPYLLFRGRIYAARHEFATAAEATAELVRLAPVTYSYLAAADVLLAAGDRTGALNAVRSAFPESSDVHFYQDAYRDALALEDRVLESPGETESGIDRADIALLRAFFEPIPLRRAALVMNAAELSLGRGRDDAAAEQLQRATTLTLHEPLSDATRVAARRAGAACARLGAAAKSRSLFADRWERLAERRGFGPLLHEFRVALLTGLELPERAKAAQAELNPPPRKGRH